MRFEIYLNGQFFGFDYDRQIAENFAVALMVENEDNVVELYRVVKGKPAVRLL